MSSLLNDDALSILDENLNPNIKERQYGRTIGIHSKKRSGKTLTAVALTKYYLDNSTFLQGVISNIYINEKKIGKPVRPLTDIKMIKMEDYRKYIILTDEFRNIIDSRMSSSFKNLFISNLLADTGKFMQIHILTDQDANSIDRRIRVNADAVLKPQIDFDSGVCTVKVVPTYRSFFMLEAYEEWEKYDVEFYYSFREYYDYYNTEQHIEDYFITFTPEELFEEFMVWVKERKYDKINDFIISKGTLVLWREMNPHLYLSDRQLTALLEYMKWETDLHMLRGGRKRK